MKKALLVAAATIALSPMAQAQDTYNTTSTQSVYNRTESRTSASTGEVSPLLSGFYAGLQGGHSWIDADTGVGSADLKGWEGGVFGGFKLGGFVEENLGINAAIEAHYNWSDADDTVAGIDIEKDHDWGVSFRPGLSFVPGISSMTAISPYAIIGYRRANFEATTGGISADEDFDGFELGVGTELVAWGDIGLRVDYSHIWYEENGGIDPDEDSLRMGLAWHF